MILCSTLRLLALALLLLTTGACKKTTDAITARKCLIRSIDFSFSGSSDFGETFDYNATGQPTKIAQPGGYNSSTGVQVQEYTYSSGQITMKINPAPVQQGVLSATYLLNSSGYITKIATVSRPYGSTTLKTENQFFEYNADGYLAKITSTDGSYNTLNYTNSNITEEKQYNGSGVLQTTTTSTFYEDKTPPVLAIVSYFIEFPAFYAAGLFGKTAKNPTKQSVAVGTSSSYSGTTNYTHAYDADGNIVTTLTASVAKGGSPSSTYTTNYSYVCP